MAAVVLLTVLLGEPPNPGASSLFTVKEKISNRCWRCRYRIKEGIKEREIEIERERAELEQEEL